MKYIFIDLYPFIERYPSAQIQALKSALRKVLIEMIVPLINLNSNYLIFPNPKIQKIITCPFYFKERRWGAKYVLDFFVFHGKGRLWKKVGIWEYLKRIHFFNYFFIHFIYLSKRYIYHFEKSSQLAFNCSKLTIETLEQGVKYVQSL